MSGNVPSSNIVLDVKNYPKNWDVDEIITEFGYGETKKEIMLVHKKSARLDDYDQEGKLNFNRNPVYRWESFNAWQRFEIKKVKNISGGYYTNEEIKWIVREVKEDLGVWKIKKLEDKDWLVHDFAQINRDEIGTLIHDQQKFNEAEWAEISGMLGRVNDIKQNAKLERGLFVVNQETGEISENEDWFIHNQLERKVDDRTGYLIYVPNAMIRAKDLSEAEQKAVNYSKSEAQSQFVSIIPKGDEKSIGSGGVFAIIGVVSALLVASIAIVRKRLNNKSNE